MTDTRPAAVAIETFEYPDEDPTVETVPARILFDGDAYYAYADDGSELTTAGYRTAADALRALAAAYLTAGAARPEQIRNRRPTGGDL